MFKANRLLAIIVLFFFVLIMGSCGKGGGGGSSSGGGDTPPPTTSENYTLTVVKFGEGVIVDNQSGINCGANCSQTYPQDTTLVLTATASNGSVFKSWAGCDSVADNTCTVTMNSNKTVSPTFALSEFKYQPTTKVLDDSTMQHLVRQEGTIYYFDSQATTVKDLQAGDVIMSSSDKGLLRRVTAVSVLPDGSFAVETTDATLEDAIEKGTIAFTEKLTYAQLKSPANLIQGVRLQEALKPESVDFTFFIDATIPDEAGNTIKITGSNTINFEPDFALTIDWEGLRPKLKEFKSIFTTKNTQSLSITGNINVIDKKVKLNQTPLIWVVPTNIGPVTIEVDIFLGIKGGASVTAKVSTEVVYTAGIYYKTETGWKTVNEWSRKAGSIDNAPSTSATASVKPYVRPELKVMLWKTVGPYANLDGYLKLEAGISNSPWWKIYGGVDASIGAKMTMISWTVVNVGFNFNIVEWEIASSVTQNQNPIISAVTPNPSSVKTGETSTVTCVASDPDNDPLIYSWSATGGSIPGSSATATWTAPSTSGTYTVTCTVSDGKVSVSKGVNITVSESTTPLSITTTSLSSGTVGVSYGTNLSATGGKTPFTWSIISGSLPSGLSLSTSGLISGIPTTAGTYNFTVQVKDSSLPQQTASKAFSILVNPSGGYSISGRVTLNSTGFSGVTINLTGTGSTSTTTDSNGNYSFTGAQNGLYTITPSMAGYTFSPPSKSITVNNANVTGQDFTATPSSQTFSLTVTKTGSGSGTVTSSPAGINCGSTCSASFNQGSSVTLTPTPATGSTFAGWSGSCSGSGTCTMTMDGNKNVTATFNTTTGGVLFTSLTPSTISTSTAGYQETLSATGSNFNNVNQVTFTWVGATSGSVAWFRGDTNWNSKVTVNSDTSMTLRPVVTAAGDPAGTTTWYVTLTDTIGATASRSFTVTYTPPTAQSDLIIQNLSVYPTSGSAGTSATVSFTIKNQGSGTANANTTNIRINTSSSNVTTSDQLLVSLSIPSISAGSIYNVNQSVTIPSSRPSGTNYIWVILDVNNTANQVNGSCNIATDPTCNDYAKTVFTVTTSTGCSEVEPNDSSSQANPLTLNVGCTGKISSSTDKDWFDVYVSSGTTISFTLTVPTGLDYDMALYGPDSSNPSQHWLKESINPAGQNETINYTTSATGYFAVQIYGYQGAYSTTSTYTITRTQ